MPLGTEVGLSPGDIVLDGDPASPPRKGHRSPAVFGPCLLWSNVRPYRLLLSTCYIVQATLYKTCSAVVEPGDRLTTILMDRKVGDVPHFGGVGSASHAMWPGPMPASIPCGILIHPAVWPQRTWAKNWWLCPFWGELGPHLTQRGRGRGVRPCQVKLCTAHDAYVQCVHGAAQQPMTLLIFALRCCV